MTAYSRRKDRFTLIELLTVITIIFILAAMLIGIAGVITRNTNEAKTKARMEAMMMALQEHFQDRGYFPQQTGPADLSFAAAAFVHSQTGRPYLEGYNGGPYLDGWQRAFQYSSADAAGTPWPEGYHLSSNGHDKIANTADDICSWKQR